MRSRQPMPRGTGVPWVVALGLLVMFFAQSGHGGVTRKPAPAKWVSLPACRLVADQHRDGDSFHVQFGQQEFIFRLYFVDCPEVDDSFKDRNREQCKYFGVTAKENRKAGEKARDFSARTLEKPFVVVTRWQNAMGRSKLPRYYAFIQADGKDLGETLIGQGLARSKGAVCILPNGRHAKDYAEDLDKLEDQAKAAKLGIWAVSNKVH